MDLEPESDLSVRARQLFGHIFGRVGHCVEFRTSSFARSMELVRQGALDGDFFRIKKYGELVPGVIRVDEPMAITKYAIYAREKRFKELVSREAFRDWSGEPLLIGYPRGAVMGNDAVEWLEKNTTHKIYNIPHPERGMRMVRQGRLDIFLAMHIVADPMLLEDGMRRAGVYKVGVFSSYPGYIYLNKRFAYLVPCLEEAIRECKADGSFERLAGYPPPPSER